MKITREKPRFAEHTYPFKQEGIEKCHWRKRLQIFNASDIHKLKRHRRKSPSGLRDPCNLAKRSGLSRGTIFPLNLSLTMSAAEASANLWKPPRKPRWPDVTHYSRPRSVTSHPHGVTSNNGTREWRHIERCHVACHLDQSTHPDRISRYLTQAYEDDIRSYLLCRLVHPVSDMKLTFARRCQYWI